MTLASLGLAVVADGMGGYKAGEVASAIAAKTILDDVRDGMADSRKRPTDRDPGLSGPSTILRDAIARANREVYRTAHTVQQCQGMGTTVVAVLFYNNNVSVGHVGDSRVYRFRDDSLTQVTSDHSLIQELIDRGFFTPEEAAENTPKNLVTRALGIEEHVKVDIQEQAALTGDIYLLCSDGLTDMVDDEEIHLTLSKYSVNLAEAAQELVRLANESGGKDNISVVLAKLRGPFPSKSGFFPKFN